MSCSMSIEQTWKLCKVKFFQLQSMSNAIRYINQRFAFNNSGTSCLDLIFNLSNPRMTSLHAKKQFQVARNDDSCTVIFIKMIRMYDSLVEASHSKSDDLGSIPAGCLNHLPPIGHFAWHWTRKCTDTRAFILLRALFLLLGFRQRRFRANRVVNLNTTIRLPLLWRTWTRALAPHSPFVNPHVRAWRMRVMTAIVEPRSKNHKSNWPLLFLELSKILENNGTLWGVFNPHPPNWIQAEFLTKFCHFPNSWRCSPHRAKTAPRLPCKMAWRFQGPSCQPLYFKNARKKSFV